MILQTCVNWERISKVKMYFPGCLKCETIAKRQKLLNKTKCMKVSRKAFITLSIVGGDVGRYAVDQ